MTPLQSAAQLPSLNALKAQAKRLRAAMAEKQTPVSQSMALEALAKQWGYRDWNTLSAALKSNAPPQWHVGQAVYGWYLGHPFKGKLKAVRLAQGGYCYVTVVFDQAIDVVKSEGFSAFRKQVNATLDESGTTPAKLSDGTAQMVLKPL